MKSKEALITDFEKYTKKLLNTVVALQKHDSRIIIKCQDNMVTLCIDNKDTEDDLDCAEDISEAVDFTGYMETLS